METKRQPVISTSLTPGLYNSIHSSFGEAAVPIHATSLMSISIAGGQNSKIVALSIASVPPAPDAPYPNILNFELGLLSNPVIGVKSIDSE
ncbi:MAG: hypothetical protein IH588_12735 [Anaerolineales bacterium]|nr:hypothetical protein [Anaerolineales bacterium]